MWLFSAKASGSWEIAKKLYFGAKLAGAVKAPFKQPYFNQRFLDTVIFLCRDMSIMWWME